MGRQRDETFSEFVREQSHKLGLRLDDIVTQNRATIEAVQVSRAALEERIDRYDRESRERDGVLEAAIRATQADVAGLRTDVAGLRTDVRELKVGVQQNSVDIRELSARVAVVERLDERVSALERRAG